MLHRRLIALTGTIRGHLALTTSASLAATATHIAQAMLIAAILSRVTGGARLAELALPLGVLGGLVTLRAALVWLREISQQATAATVKERIRLRLAARLLELGPGYLLRTRSGATMSSLVDGVEGLEAYYARYLPQLITALVGPLAILIVISRIDPLATALMAVCVATVAVGPRLFDRLLGKRGRSHWHAYTRLGADYLDAMRGMTILKAFNAAGRRRSQLQRRSHLLYRATMAQMAVSLIDTAITTTGIGAGVAVATVVGSLHRADGTISTTGLFTLLLLARECFRPFGQLSAYWHAGYLGISAVADIDRLLRAEAGVVEAPDAVAALPAAALLRRTALPAVAFHHVGFTYDARTTPALDGLSLHIHPGETVALVGPSGSGKTTAVALLLRFFDPTSGRITLGGVDIRTLTLASLRASVAVVWQDTYLFHGTIADNLRLARPGAPDTDLIRAARTAAAHDFITALPDGYDTRVGERGLTLSGGQRQRVALARALLADAPVLVLDEATSHVDPASEAAIQDALTDITRDRSTLVIAHRLSTIQHADRIVVLDNGTVDATGSHHDLLRDDGLYARLTARQTVAP